MPGTAFLVSKIQLKSLGWCTSIYQVLPRILFVSSTTTLCGRVRVNAEEVILTLIVTEDDNKS